MVTALRWIRGRLESIANNVEGMAQRLAEEKWLRLLNTLSHPLEAELSAYMRKNYWEKHIEPATAYLRSMISDKMTSKADDVQAISGKAMADIECYHTMVKYSMSNSKIWVRNPRRRSRSLCTEILDQWVMRLMEKWGIYDYGQAGKSSEWLDCPIPTTAEYDAWDYAIFELRGEWELIIKNPTSTAP